MPIAQCASRARQLFKGARFCSSCVRVRFAPSPTGDLHLGGLRTALVNYLTAKTAGKGSAFLLRIEDTDRARNVAGGTEKLVEMLRWAHLEFDEGPGKGGPHAPYVQSERLAIYQAHADELIAKGAAYPCFCPPNKEKTSYDRTCLKLSREQAMEQLARHRAEKKPFVIRLKMEEGALQVEDALRGSITIDSNVLDDAILIKSDGFPTYHLAAATDDHLMEITHVIRGEEWLMSLPKAMLIYKALGWKLPVFVHLPVILNPEGGKLSKRHGHSSVESLKEAGYLWQAVVNYLGVLGTHDTKQNMVMSLSELQQGFKLSHLSVSKPMFDLAKLNWFNQQYIKVMSEEDIARAVEWLTPSLVAKFPLFFQSRSTEAGREYVLACFKLLQSRLVTLKDLLSHEYLFGPPQFAEDTTKAVLKVPAISMLQELHRSLSASSFTATELDSAMQHMISSQKLPKQHVFLPLRFAVTGRGAGPSLSELLEFLGKEQSLHRINTAQEYLLTKTPQ